MHLGRSCNLPAQARRLQRAHTFLQATRLDQLMEQSHNALCSMCAYTTHTCCRCLCAVCERHAWRGALQHTVTCLMRRQVVPDDITRTYSTRGHTCWSISNVKFHPVRSCSNTLPACNVPMLLPLQVALPVLTAAPQAELRCRSSWCSLRVLPSHARACAVWAAHAAHALRESMRVY